MAATVLGYLLLVDLSSPKPGQRLDGRGVAAFSLSLLALLSGLLLLVTRGVRSGLVWGLLGLAVLGVGLFLRWETRAEYPAFDPVLFRSRAFDFAVVAASLQSLAMFSVQFLVVFYLQAVRGYSPFDAALLLVPFPVAPALVGPFAGRLSDRIGVRIPATVGLLVQFVGLEVLASIGPSSQYLLVAVGLGVAGIGGGLFFAPNTSSALSASPMDRLGVASAALATLRNTGMVTSFALALSVAAAAIPHDVMLALFVGTSGNLAEPLKAAFAKGMSAALHVSALVCIVAAAMSFVRGKGSSAADGKPLA